MIAAQQFGNFLFPISGPLDHFTGRQPVRQPVSSWKDIMLGQIILIYDRACWLFPAATAVSFLPKKMATMAMKAQAVPKAKRAKTTLSAPLLGQSQHKFDQVQPSFFPLFRPRLLGPFFPRLLPVLPLAFSFSHDNLPLSYQPFCLKCIAQYSLKQISCQ